jgi:hypothetical protein
MLLNNYKTLIKSLPVRQISGTTKRTTWQKYETNYPWLHQLNDEIFNGKESVTLSRQDIIDSKSTIRHLIIKIILWGYLKGMRGNHFSNILSKIEVLESILLDLCKIENLTKADFEIAKVEFNKIKGIGLSTYSKLLYFLQLKIDGYPCLILDFRIIDILEKNRIEDFQILNKITRWNGHKYYIEFLRTADQQAKRIETKSENVEQFIYTFGGIIKE